MKMGEKHKNEQGKLEEEQSHTYKFIDNAQKNGRWNSEIEW